jgi:hypothetical protein
VVFGKASSQRAEAFKYTLTGTTAREEFQMFRETDIVAKLSD